MNWNVDTTIIDWEVIVQRLGPRLYNYFIRRGFLKESSDLTQEVFSRLYQKLASQQFDEAKGSLDAFAFGIARFVALENNQHSQIYKSAQDDFDWESVQDFSDSANIEQTYQQNQTIEMFLLEIKSLPPVQQEILALYLDEDTSLDDISTLMKLPIGTVKSHLHRSKEKLRTILQQKGIGL